MSDEELKTEQTAVADNTQEAPKEEAPAESGAAQDDGLDALLKEFDQRKEAVVPKEEPLQAEPTKTPELSLTALAAIEQRLNQQEAREQRRELERVFNRFTDGVQADAIDAEAFLNAAALRDPRINQAYTMRATNPKTWDKIEGTLKTEFARRFGKKVDRQVTESKEAVASAVRNASTAAPNKEITDADVKSMSKDEFDDIQRKLGITPV